MAETINTVRLLPHPTAVTFAVTPVLNPISITVGGNTYTWSAQSNPTVPAKSNLGTNTVLTLTATPTLAPGVTAVEYKWDMGDGAILFGPVVQHTFTTIGPDIIIRLVLTDSRGFRARAFQVASLIAVNPLLLQTNLLLQTDLLLN